MRPLLLGASLSGLLAVSAAAQWLDNFDSYPCNQNINGQGGWKGDAYVRCAPNPARSAPNALEIGRPGDDADVVHEFSGYTSGRWSFRAYQYIPSSFVGKTYFILMHTYEDGDAKGWSVQVWFDAATKKVHVDNFNCPPQPPDTNIVFNQWVEIRVDIDFDNDRYDFWYGGYRAAKDKSWSKGIFCGDDGALDLAAVDLYANNSYSWYYDDFEILQTVGACCDEATGQCQDNVYAGDCQRLEERFVAFQKCTDISPPCGQGVGACCFRDPDCARPCFETTYPRCKSEGGDWLGFASTCYNHCECLVCRDGIEGDPEGEPECGPGYFDKYNGGCLNNPPRPNALEMYKPGQNHRAFCAKSGTFVAGGEKTRDADWYHVAVPSVPTLLVAEWKVEFPAVVGMYDNNGQPTCKSRFLKDAKTSPPGKSDSFFTCLVPGDWYVVVRPSVLEKVSCAVKYRIEFTRNDFGGQGCQPAAGACCLGIGNCVITDEVDCEVTKKGYYLGDDTTCQGAYCPECPPNTLYGQLPDVAERSAWTTGTSDTIDTKVYVHYEDFVARGRYAVSELHWWGLDLGRDPNGWIECDDPQPTFEIKFWRNTIGPQGHQPDLSRPVGQTYLVTATVQTVKQLSGNRQLKFYTARLNPAVRVASRTWVSVSGKDEDPTNCYFLWFSANGGPGQGYSWSTVNGVGRPSDFDLSACFVGERLNRMADMNCDGVTNGFDIDPFVLVLTDPVAYAQRYPNCDYMLADMNLDGLVNNFDIDPFVVCLTTGVCP